MRERLKTIGKAGQLYLGKEFAGQDVLVTQTQKGVWTIKTTSKSEDTVEPRELESKEKLSETELWALKPENLVKIAEGLEWAKHTPLKITTEEEMEALFAKVLANH